MKIFFLLVAVSASTICTAQQVSKNTITGLVEAAVQKGMVFKPVSIFTYRQQATITGKGIYHELLLDEQAAATMLAEKPLAIEIKIPTGPGNFLEVDLLKVNMGNPRFKTNNRQYRNDVHSPLSYRGIVKNGSSNSQVSLTLNNQFVTVAANLNNKRYSIATSSETETPHFYLYNTDELTLPELSFDCATKAPAGYKTAPDKTTTATPLASGDKCVYVFADCTQNLYNAYHFSGLQGVINQVFALYNDVGTAYLNEQINIKLSEINVWTQTDPFNHSDRDTALHDFAFYYQDNYWGNMAVLLDFSTNISGIAAYIGKVKGELPNNCPGFNPNPQAPGEWWGGGPLCFCDLNYGGRYRNFPVPENADQVYMIIHEMGHLLGSPHTHWCGWNLGNNTFGALDNCAATEGGCAMGPAPTDGGTFMSYCISNPLYINFNNGFGPKPGAAIRNFVSNNSCINNCPSCPGAISIGDIGTGINRFEASDIISANGLVPSGSFSVFDAGNKVVLSPGFRATDGSALKIFNNGCGGIQ